MKLSFLGMCAAAIVLGGSLDAGAISNQPKQRYRQNDSCGPVDSIPASCQRPVNRSNYCKGFKELVQNVARAGDSIPWTETVVWCWTLVEEGNACRNPDPGLAPLCREFAMNQTTQGGPCKQQGFNNAREMYLADFHAMCGNPDAPALEPIHLTLENNQQNVGTQIGQDIIVTLERGPVHPCFGGLWDVSTLTYNDTMLSLVEWREEPNPKCPQGRVGCHYNVDVLQFRVKSEAIDTQLKILKEAAGPSCASSTRADPEFSVRVMNWVF